MFEKLPKILKQRIVQIFPDISQQTLIHQAFSFKKPITFRVNTLLSSLQEIQQALEKNSISYELGPIEGSFIVKGVTERSIWDLDIYSLGKMYMQSLASQLPALYLDVSSHQKILDVTAAPGGKTSQISALSKNTGHIDACDVSHIRLEKMKHNLQKLGCTNIEIHQIDARTLSEKFGAISFDRILFDAPCSGEGSIEYSNTKFLENWDMKHILNNSLRQKQIIDQIIPLLKSKGIFVYSTCTLAPEENEEIVSYILKSFPELQIQKISFESPYSLPGIVHFLDTAYSLEVQNALRIIPNELSEGFFIAKFQKV